MTIYLGESIPTPSKVVWTNGCYDVLHVGHSRLFSYCRQLCGEQENCKLVVGIDSDFRVKQLKGNSRPINNQNDRAEMLLSIKGVSGVYIYDTREDLESIVLSLKPEVMVVGEEYASREVIGSQYSKSVKFFAKVEGYSTTNLMMKGSHESSQVK